MKQTSLIARSDIAVDKVNIWLDRSGKKGIDTNVGLIWMDYEGEEGFTACIWIPEHKIYVPLLGCLGHPLIWGNHYHSRAVAYLKEIEMRHQLCWPGNPHCDRDGKGYDWEQYQEMADKSYHCIVPFEGFYRQRLVIPGIEGSAWDVCHNDLGPIFEERYLASHYLAVISLNLYHDLYTSLMKSAMARMRTIIEHLEEKAEQHGESLEQDVKEWMIER